MTFAESLVKGTLRQIDDGLCILSCGSHRYCVFPGFQKQAFQLLDDPSCLSADNFEVSAAGKAVFIAPDEWGLTIFKDEIPVEARSSFQGVVLPETLEITKIKKYDFGISVQPKEVEAKAMTDKEVADLEKRLGEDRKVGIHRRANHRKEGQGSEKDVVHVPVVAVHYPDGTVGDYRRGDPELKKAILRNRRYGSKNLPPGERIVDAPVLSVSVPAGDGQDPDREVELTVQYEDAEPFIGEDGTIDVWALFSSHPRYQMIFEMMKSVDIRSLSPDRIEQAIDELDDLVDSKLAEISNRFLAQIHADIGWLVELGEATFIRDRSKHYRRLCLGLGYATAACLLWMNVASPIFGGLGQDPDRLTAAEFTSETPVGRLLQAGADAAGLVFNGTRISKADEGKQLMLPDGGICTVTSAMGARVSPTAGASSDHPGTDFGCSGSPRQLSEGHDNDGEGRRHYLYAPANAELEILEPSKTGGGGLVARLTFGNGKRLQILHMHEIDPAEGRVNQGQLIGIGSAPQGSENAGTGTGPHDHFEVYDLKDKNAIDTKDNRVYEPMTWNMAKLLYGAFGMGQAKD